MCVSLTGRAVSRFCFFFAGNLHARWMFRHTLGWGGWGGVGCNVIVDLARMLDVPSHVVLGWVGWGGVGCNVIVDLARTLDVPSHVGLGWVGWGGV